MSGDSTRPSTTATASGVPQMRDHRTLAGRLWAGVLALWGAITGIAPHVLHHIGPLAGAALFAGAGGTVLFAAIAIVVSIPFLVRIHRHFHNWIAPAIAVALMSAMFLISTMVIGPAIRDSSDTPAPPGIEAPELDEHGH